MLFAHKYRLVHGYALAAVALCSAEESRAQLDLEVLAQRRPDLFAHVTSARLNAGKPARLIVRNTSLNASLPRISTSEGYSVVAATHAMGLPHLAWTPPKRLLLDEAVTWIELEAYRTELVATARDAMSDATLADAQGRGAGVVVGIVDGGIDFTHPDLQNEDGSTRVAWFLDYASPPLGIHTALEEQYGCTLADSPCAILSADDINENLLGAGDVLLPADRLGHGTHVASLAAGSGRASALYAGVAPEATLIVARISATSSDVQDADVLLATQFVYERADELGLPSVVNLSLGGDFGPHDGTTLLEQALLAFLDVPGRALVVAAGNSASMFEASNPDLPGPFGVHTDVYIDGSDHVTVTTPDELTSYEGDIFVWVDAQNGQRIEVGIRSGRDVVVSPVAPDGFDEGSTDEWEALVSNQAPFEEDELSDYEHGVLVLLTGTFTSNEKIDILLRGSGTASLWVQSTGELALEAGSRGALFSAARRGGTITVPATAAGLIAVGATLNRERWPSLSRNDVSLFPFTDQLDSTPGSVAFFSSLGPNQLGQLKPDIVAPGALVIGAMAPSAHPAQSSVINYESMFTSTPICGDEPMCAVVNNEYGIALGTSMAAPIVTGAVALLLASDPSLRQNELLDLLQTGATRIRTSKTTPDEESVLPPAPGMLDLARTFSALKLFQSSTSDALPSAETSWLTLADSYVTPRGLVRGLLRTRDAADVPADVELEMLSLEVEHGIVEEPLSRRAPGLFDFAVRADASVDDVSATGVGEHALAVRVRFGENRLTEVEVPVALDVNALRGFRQPVRRLTEESGCSVAIGRGRTSHNQLPPAGLIALVTGLFLLNRGRVRCAGRA